MFCFLALFFSWHTVLVLFLGYVFLLVLIPTVWFHFWVLFVWSFSCFLFYLALFLLLLHVCVSLFLFLFVWFCFYHFSGVLSFFSNIFSFSFSVSTLLFCCSVFVPFSLFLFFFLISFLSVCFVSLLQSSVGTQLWFCFLVLGFCQLSS